MSRRALKDHYSVCRRQVEVQSAACGPFDGMGFSLDRLGGWDGDAVDLD